MGRIARAASDLLVLTTERWRPGEPNAPARGLVEGALGVRDGECELIPDRRRAIDRAIASARDGDVVLVLGRGARGGHLLDEHARPRRFDDRDEARAALRARGTVPG
jgi:UDP-N-acetylmuramoyl-L-alanyl-D-glutamate--2,6-diaminopimelate ligase